MGIERASRDGWHLTCCSIVVIAVDSIELTLFCKLMKWESVCYDHKVWIVFPHPPIYLVSSGKLFFADVQRGQLQICRMQNTEIHTRTRETFTSNGTNFTINQCGVLETRFRKQIRWWSQCQSTNSFKKVWWIPRLVHIIKFDSEAILWDMATNLD